MKSFIQILRENENKINITPKSWNFTVDHFSNNWYKYVDKGDTSLIDKMIYEETIAT